MSIDWDKQYGSYVGKATTPKKSSINWDKEYGTFVGKVQPVKPTFKQKLTGGPIKQNDGSFKANTGFFPVVKEVFNTLNEGTIGVGKTLGQAISVNRGDFDELNNINLRNQDNLTALTKTILQNRKLGKDTKGLEDAWNYANEQLGNKDTIESLAPNSQDSAKKVTGNILLMAAGMVGAGEIAVGGKSGVLLARKAIKAKLSAQLGSEVIKTQLKKGAFNTAVGYGVDVGLNLLQDKKGGDMFKPGIGTLLGGGVSAFTGVGAVRAANKLAPELINSRALARANFGPIPEAGTPPPGFINPLQKQLPAPIQDLSYHPITGAENPNIKIKQPTAKELATGYEPYTPNSKLPDIQTDPDFVPQTKEVPNEFPLGTTETKSANTTFENPNTKQEPSAPIQKERLSTLKESVGGVDDADTVTFEKSINRFDELVKSDPDYVKKLAMGTTEKDPVLRDFWALKLLEKHADEIGDIGLSYELSLSKAGREAGRELVGGKITSMETTSDIIRNARKQKANKLGISEDRLIREEKEIADNLKKNSANTTSTTADSNDALKELIC